MKKCFVLTMFGEPFPWIQDYIDNVQKLEKYGWYWKIFTPADIKSKGNVDIIPMTIEQFDDLVEKKLQVRPTLTINERGVPSSHITDFYVFTGVIFEDYLVGYDFWGITNPDIVYGRLDHFVPDKLLEDCDIFSDDVNRINGIFSLWRNVPEVNTLFKYMANWRDAISQPPCRGCVTGKKHEHILYVTDEIVMTEVMKMDEVLAKIRYKYPKYYPMHSYDRLEQHIPVPKLTIKDDGSLWELFRDDHEGSGWPLFGREIPYFHFNDTKKWPNIAY